jgi:hypothetical protein
MTFQSKESTESMSQSARGDGKSLVMIDVSKLPYAGRFYTPAKR